MRTYSQARNNTITLFKQQGGKCFYCKDDMFLRGDVTKKFFRKHRTLVATFDHIVVKSKGGTYSIDNGVCACQDCNGMRDTLDQATFIENFDKIRTEWLFRRSEKVRRRRLHRQQRHDKLARQKLACEYRQRSNAKTCFLTARFAMQIGKTVEDLFNEFVYTSTQETVRDL